MLGRFTSPTMFFFALASNAPAPSPSVVREVGTTAVDVGRVFQSGQTDGLILYAMILGTFLMFLVAVALAILVLRSQKSHADAVTRKDDQMAAQTKLFIEATDRTAAAITSLSVSVASDVQERAQNGQTLAQIQTLMGKLAHVE